MTRFSLRNFIAISVLLVSLTFGCRQIVLDRDQIVSNDFPIVLLDDSLSQVPASTLYLRLANSDLVPAGGIIDSSIYFDTLQRIVVESLVSLEAQKVNLRDDFYLYRVYLFRYNDLLINYFYKNFIVDSIHVDSATLDTFYRQFPAQYSYREQVRASHLVISAEGLRHGKDSLVYRVYTDEALDSIAREKVFELKRRIDAGEALETMAFEYSVHRESGNRYGDLGFFPRGTYNPEFEVEAFALPVGGISQPFKTRDGWHILKVTDRVEPGLAPLTGEVMETARRHYVNLKAGERARHLLDSLTASAHLRYNDSALEVVVGIPDTTWAVVVNEVDTVFSYRMSSIFSLFQTQLKLDSLTLHDKRNALLREAQKLLLAQAAQDFGFSRSPFVEGERKRLYHKYATDFVMKGQSDPDYLPNDSLIADYYERNITQFQFPKPLYVQHIIVEDSVLGEYIRDQAMSGVDFLELAKEFYPGAEEIREAAADLGYIGRDEMPESFFLAALATPVGDVSHPVRTEWGYHVIKVLERKSDLTMQQARGMIVDSLKVVHNNEKIRQWEKELFDRHKLTYNLKRLAKVTLPPKERR